MMYKMRKVLLVLLIGMILISLVSAVVFTDNIFKDKVLTISSSLFYDKLINLDKVSSKEIPKNTELDLSDSGLEITRNKEGVLKVRAKWKRYY